MEWIYKELIESAFNDDQAEIMDWSEFEDNYTLHDSYWVGMSQDVMGDMSVLCAFEWDTVWQGERLKKLFGNKSALLVIKFPALDSVKFTDVPKKPIADSPVAGSQYENRVVKIENIYGGVIHLEPVTEVAIWLYDENRKQYNIKEPPNQ